MKFKESKMYILICWQGKGRGPNHLVYVVALLSVLAQDKNAIAWAKNILLLEYAR